MPVLGINRCLQAISAAICAAINTDPNAYITPVLLSVYGEDVLTSVYTYCVIFIPVLP